MEICGGIYVFPNRLQKLIFGWFSRATGNRDERGPLTPQLVDNKNRDFKTLSLLLPPRLMTRSSDATPGARVVPSQGNAERQGNRRSRRETAVDESRNGMEDRVARHEAD